MGPKAKNRKLLNDGTGKSRRDFTGKRFDDVEDNENIYNDPDNSSSFGHSQEIQDQSRKRPLRTETQSRETTTTTQR